MYLISQMHCIEHNLKRESRRSKIYCKIHLNRTTTIATTANGLLSSLVPHFQIIATEFIASQTEQQHKLYTYWQKVWLLLIHVTIRKCSTGNWKLQLHTPHRHFLSDFLHFKFSIEILSQFFEQVQVYAIKLL